MKPFLFLGTRSEDDVADGEYAAVLGFSGLDEAELHRHRLEASTRCRRSTWRTGRGSCSAAARST